MAIQIISSLAWADEPASNTNIDAADLRLFGGYSWYTMKEFNNKLKREGNKTIDGGLNAGIELSQWFVVIPRLNIPIKVPVFGIEYLGVSSKTTHCDVMDCATVNWDLQVIGGYITADVAISKKITWFYLRPISIGIYNLGGLLKAGLTISDRPGSLDASGNVIGVSTAFNLRSKFVKGSPFFIFMAVGYRWLKFTDVELTPEGGYPAQPSTLPESLDYGGFRLGGGVGAEF